MKENLIDKINWDAYHEHLVDSITNERLWARGSFDSTARLHKANVAKLEEELKMLENGEYQDIIDLHAEEMGEDVNEFFEDFFKSRDKQEKKQRENLFLDALADIALYAGWQHLEFEDSKMRSITLRSWAKEFTDLHAQTDWQRADYIDMVERFAESKVKNWSTRKEGITDINIYSGRDGGMFIRCKIDGEQQMARKMLFADVCRFNDNTDRTELAQRYFKDVLENSQDCKKGLGR